MPKTTTDVMAHDAIYVLFLAGITLVLTFVGMAMA